MIALSRLILTLGVVLASMSAAAQLQGPMPGSGQPIAPTFAPTSIDQIDPSNPAALLSAAGQMLPSDGPSSSQAA
ncbi:MAG: hypothetical protein AAFY46_09100, partial [Planctomycetota bacterium]